MRTNPESEGVSREEYSLVEALTLPIISIRVLSAVKPFKMHHLLFLALPDMIALESTPASGSMVKTTHTCRSGKPLLMK